MKRVSISPFSLSLKREREPASRRQESPPASSNSPPNLFLLAVSAADLKFTGNASQSWVSSSCLNLGLAQLLSQLFSRERLRNNTTCLLQASWAGQPACLPLIHHGLSARSNLFKLFSYMLILSSYTMKDVLGIVKCLVGWKYIMRRNTSICTKVDMRTDQKTGHARARESEKKREKM